MVRAARHPRTYTLSSLRAKCTELRRLLAAHGSGAATESELAAAWPGGALNALNGLDGWIECYAMYRSLSDRHEMLSARAETASSELERVVRAAAARQGVPVALSIGDRMVYPKSAWALAFLDALDAVVEPLVEAQAAIVGSEDPEAIRALPPLATGLAWRTWAWILLHEGVDLPFPDEGEIEPPTFTEQLAIEDYLLIWKAHRELHYEASVLMALAMPKEPGEASRLSLGGFLAGYGSEHGIAPSTIIRRWSFPEALAAAVASAESHRVAEANAKRKQGANT